MITSQQTNGTTDPALFAKGGPPNLHIKIPEFVLQHWAKQREAAKAQDEAAKAQIEFYNAVRPSAFILGFTQIDQPRIVVPRNIQSAEEFRALVKEAEDKRENLFFHVGAGGTTATKDQILDCPYLWGDCDPDRTKDEEQDWQEIEKELRGLSDWGPGVKLLLLSSTPESYVVPVGYSLLFAVGAWAAA